MVEYYTVAYYLCVCDSCGKKENVNRSETVYNAAQAARYLGWSYGRDRKCYCKSCRRNNYGDNYKWFK